MNNFKRILLLLAFVATHVLSVQSQDIRYGVILGADITNMHLKEGFGSDFRNMYNPILSYNLNGFVTYKGDFLIGISIEPGIIRKGGVQLFDYMNSQYQPVYQQVIASITSLQLPLLIDFHLGDRLYLSAGVELEYRISQKAVMTDKLTTNHVSRNSVPFYVGRGTGNHTIGDDIIPDHNYPSNFYSGIVGLQYRINERFDAGLRYGTSLKELYSVLWFDINGYVMSGSYLYTSYLQFSLKVKL